MRHFTKLPILALLALVAVASAATAFQNSIKCGERFPNIHHTLDQFCRHCNFKDGEPACVKQNLVIPSEYARQGFGFTGQRGNKFKVSIEGNCKPAQWLPYKYCVQQFEDMCANTKNEWGYATRRYGNNGCQKFIIGPRSGNGKTLQLPTVPFRA